MVSVAEASRLFGTRNQLLDREGGLIPQTVDAEFRHLYRMLETIYIELAAQANRDATTLGSVTAAELAALHTLGNSVVVLTDASGNLSGHDEGIDAVMPPGLVAPYAGTSAPTGWLLCDGSAVSRATYAGLFTAIGTTWGVGDGSSTFNLPDLRDSFPKGKNSDAVADTGGAATHDHSVPALSTPAHTHPLGDAGHAQLDPDGGASELVFRQKTTGVTSWNGNVVATGVTVASGARNGRTDAIYLAGATESGGSGSTGTGTTGSASSYPPYATVLYIIKT